MSAGAAAAAGASMSTASAQSEPDYGDWFSDVSNFDGTYDFTGKSEVTVTVGAQGNGGAFAFSPAAIRVDPGTKVVWEWTGKGGSHNVVDNGGSFESDMISTAGETYSRTFDSEGTFKYYCQPHKMMGMKGAVVVGGSGGKDPSELSSGSSGGSGSGSGSSGGSGSGSSSGSSGGNADAKDAEFFSGATIVTGVVMAFLSPLVFAALLFLKRPDDGRE
jgi:halocyanin-like protein